MQCELRRDYLTVYQLYKQYIFVYITVYCSFQNVSEESGINLSVIQEKNIGSLTPNTPPNKRKKITFATNFLTDRQAGMQCQLDTTDIQTRQADRYRERDRQVGKHTNIETMLDRKTDRQIDRHTQKAREQDNQTDRKTQ